MRAAAVLAVCVAAGLPSQVQAGRWVTSTLEQDPLRLHVDEVDPVSRVQSNLVTATAPQRGSTVAVVVANRQGKLYSMEAAGGGDAVRVLAT